MKNYHLNIGLPTKYLSQKGISLLEVLISLLIFSIGILGIVGIQVKALEFTNDTQYRVEAMHLANAYIAKMWAADNKTYTNIFAAEGPEYNRFKNEVATLPGAAEITDNPKVTISSGPTSASKQVEINIAWKDIKQKQTHTYKQISVIGY